MNAEKHPSCKALHAYKMDTVEIHPCRSFILYSLFIHISMTTGSLLSVVCCLLSVVIQMFRLTCMHFYIGHIVTMTTMIIVNIIMQACASSGCAAACHRHHAWFCELLRRSKSVSLAWQNEHLALDHLFLNWFWSYGFCDFWMSLYKDYNQVCDDNC